jgi:hypothetical protein
MGYALYWAAVRGRSREAVHTELSLRPTGAREEISEADWSGAALGDWQLVLDNDQDRLGEASVLSRLSRGGEVVAAWVEEHSMVSAAYGYRDGQEIWSIAHDAAKGLGDLRATGALPDCFERLAQAARAAKSPDGPDFLFDVPVDVARELTGFRHDQDLAGGFEVLEFVGEKTPPVPPAPARRPLRALGLGALFALGLGGVAVGASLSSGAWLLAGASLSCIAVMAVVLGLGR